MLYRTSKWVVIFHGKLLDNQMGTMAIHGSRRSHCQCWRKGPWRIHRILQDHPCGESMIYSGWTKLVGTGTWLSIIYGWYSMLFLMAYDIPWNIIINILGMSSSQLTNSPWFFVAKIHPAVVGGVMFVPVWDGMVRQMVHHSQKGTPVY